jgi:carotenoid cleavage dioxygenase
VPQGTNNINTYPFAGEVLASGEQGGPPIALDPITLETKGIVRWSNKLSRGMHEPAGYGDAAFTAHPKWDRETGELFGWAYRDTEPYVTLHKVSPDGSVISRELWDAPYNSVAHDIWLTPDLIVMPFQPFVASQKRIEQGLGVFGWETELPIVLALIPRDDIAGGKVRWVTADIEPEYVMHTLSCNVEGNKLTFDAPIFDRPPFPFEFDFNEVDERFYGRGYRWGYMIGGDAKRAGMSMKSLVVHDMESHAEQEFRIRHEQPAAVLEATFAPRNVDSPEGDGYLIVPVSKWAENLGEFLIFDTYDITAGPICRIELPFRMGWTPHGHWMDFRSSGASNGNGAAHAAAAKDTRAAAGEPSTPVG